MAEDTWNPWKMTVVGMLLVVAIAVVSGFVVASWAPREESQMMGAAVTAPRAERGPSELPSGADTDACNQYAKAQAGDKALEVVKNGGPGAGKAAGKGVMVGPTAGTLHGLNEAKKNDARYVEAYRACMKGRGFSS
ncbi:MAG TPA: hypothetical protein VJU81_09870 [Methylomirabilota bacterium]|nr:hypothetical protein [Methylomirabilota bacterium]